jgi:sugar lactone lactonase YvrE
VDTNGIITTVAGNGAFSYSGDGGQATNAGITSPNGIALDLSGNMFIVSGGGDIRIRKVNTNGIITTVAGNGVFGDTGDGGQGTNAQFKFPWGIAVDPAGTLFISDQSSARIRKVGTNGIITTIAGSGVSGIPADDSPANNTSLASPRGVCLDKAGNLYFSDLGANRLRKISYLEYADQPTFTLTNATMDSVNNNYSVIITSASGSVTSSVVTVNLQLPPITPGFTASKSVCTFTWSAVSNQTYQLQSATNLVTPNWIDLGSPITATNNSVSAADAVSPDGQRFYRVRLWP